MSTEMYENPLPALALVAYPMLIGAGMLAAGLAAGAFQEAPQGITATQQTQIDQNMANAQAYSSNALSGTIMTLGLLSVPVVSFGFVLWMMRKKR
jgi:nitrate reductase NapE component